MAAQKSRAVGQTPAELVGEALIWEEILDRKARCRSCRNMTGLVNLQVMEDGGVICRRCAERREVLEGPGGVVEIVG